jgi:hypothetical protein
MAAKTHDDQGPLRERHGKEERERGETKTQVRWKRKMTYMPAKTRVSWTQAERRRVRLRADEVQDLGRAQRSGGTVGVGEDMPRAPTPRARHGFNVLTCRFIRYRIRPEPVTPKERRGLGKEEKGGLALSLDWWYCKGMCGHFRTQIF